MGIIVIDIYIGKQHVGYCVIGCNGDKIVILDFMRSIFPIIYTKHLICGCCGL